MSKEELERPLPPEVPVHRVSARAVMLSGGYCDTRQAAKEVRTHKLGPGTVIEFHHQDGRPYSRYVWDGHRARPLQEAASAETNWSYLLTQAAGNREG